ncbi:MAG: hypothetical protein JWN67_858 [Actinomycetia bacterium]|nr:hypothetical protein [Actinomycetes bacterium]
MPQSAAISATVEIFERRGEWELTVGGTSVGLFGSEDAAIQAIATALRTGMGSGIHTDGGSDDAVISATVEVFSRAAQWWLTIAGELFGPFSSDDNAVDATPYALRLTP